MVDAKKAEPTERHGMKGMAKVIAACIAMAAVIVMASISVIPNVDALTMDQISDKPKKIDARSFPDERFRDYVSQNIDTDQNGYLSKAERDAVTAIGSYDPATFAVLDSGLSGMGISSLEGICFFSNLNSLVASNNNITNLPAKDNENLLYADMRGNPSFTVVRSSAASDIQLLVDRGFSMSGGVEGVDVRYVG